MEIKKKLSEEHKKKISLGVKRNLPSSSFKVGHKVNFGRIKTPATRKKISDCLKGRYCGKNHPFYGKHHTLETRKKITENQKGRIPWNKGKKGIYSREYLKKIIESAKSRSSSEEDKKRLRQYLSQFGNGHVPWNKGKKGIMPIPWNKNKTWAEAKGKEWAESKQKEMSIFWKGKRRLEEHPNWRGGTSFEPYAPEFNDKLKEAVKKRDNAICQVCGCPGSDVHHIDYNKKNSNLNNLILLCKKCHVKTNYKRDYWKEKLSQPIFGTLTAN